MQKKKFEAIFYKENLQPNYRNNAIKKTEIINLIISVSIKI